MTAADMKQEFKELYQLMATSANVNYMKAFGDVHKEMMDWFIANKPDMAKEWIEKLCAIKWKNYLTSKEAEKVFGLMNPKGLWSKDTWKQAMENLGFVTEESPYYNSCALWIEMNKQYSDSAATIAAIKGVSLSEVSMEEMVKATHMLALDMLKDADGKYSIRAHFDL